MSSKIIYASIALGMGILGAVVGIATSMTGQSEDASQARSVILAEGDDRLPNRSATDWVTYSDYVIIASAVSDSVDPADPAQVERGEGYLMRTVTMRTQEVLWSSPQAGRAYPDEFPWHAMGWQFSGDVSDRVEVAVADQPRIEVGHTYIMALQWEPPHCLGDDEQLPGLWRGLGADSTLPYDKSVIGQGELEGSPRSESAALYEAETTPQVERSLEDRMAGLSAEDLRQVLESSDATTPALDAVPQGAC